MPSDEQIIPQSYSKSSEYKKLLCRFCKSTNVIKKATRKTKNRGKIQRYLCKDCKRRFTIDDGFLRMRNSPHKITLCLDLFFQGISTRKIQAHLKTFYEKNSNWSTVYRWIVKYSKIMSNFTDKLKLKVGNELEIDVAVKKDGEKALLDYIEGKPFEEISNLVYRKGDKVISNPTEVENISLLIDLDYNLLDLEAYFQNHKKNFPDAPERTAVFFTHMGCKWREKTDGCSFCSIFHKYQRLNPKELWRKIQKLKNEHNIQGIKDYGDDFVSDREWVQEVVRARPKDLEDFVITGIYASPRYLNEDMVDNLKQLNVSYVYLGFESGNNEILRLANKGETIESNYKIAKILDKKGINILASYVLGLESESERTLKDTYEFAKRIADLDSTKLSQAGFIVPFPGSSLYRKLTEKLPEDYVGKDLFDVISSRKDWIQYFCNFSSEVNTSYNLIEETSRKIIGLSPFQTNYLGIEPD